jgi:hypothetical protein
MFESKCTFLKLAVLLMALTLPGSGQKSAGKKAAKESRPLASSDHASAEDISGMYSFLHDGEFLQIDLDQNGVSGYISRQGELESDRGQFLDQFFNKADINGHDVSFTTRAVHGVWFEFKGHFDRGNAKVRSDDGYYLLKGTLTQYISDAGKTATSRSREVEFKSLAQPSD